MTFYLKQIKFIDPDVKKMQLFGHILVIMHWLPLSFLIILLMLLVFYNHCQND